MMTSGQQLPGLGSCEVSYVSPCRLSGPESCVVHTGGGKIYSFLLLVGARRWGEKERPRKQERNINLAQGDIFESLGKTKKLSAPSEQQKFPAKTSWEFEASFLSSAETDFGSVGQSEECHHVISDSQPRLLRGGCGESKEVSQRSNWIYAFLCFAFRYNLEVGSRSLL